MSFAAGTAVTEKESQAEIKALLSRYGCPWAEVGCNRHGNGVVKFTLSGRTVRMLMSLPGPDHRERPRRWRVMALLLKAKLEAVDSGLSTFEDEFLAHLALADGGTVGQRLAPQLEAVCRGEANPSLAMGAGR